MKQSIIGLGSCGCALAEKFEEKGYNTFTIDTEERDRQQHFCLTSQSKPELYEENVPDLTQFFSAVSDEVLFIVGGSGMISSATLALLRQLKEKTITILYVQPELDMLSQVGTFQEKITFHVLQEYARSGVFKEIILVSNPAVENVVGGLALSDFFDKLNDTIVWVIDTQLNLESKKAVMNNFSKPHEVSRIITYGMVNVETGEEKHFFPLTEAREIDYFYVCNENTLTRDKGFHAKIKSQMKEKRIDDTRVAYGIYLSDHDTNYSFCILRSSKIQ